MNRSHSDSEFEVAAQCVTPPNYVATRIKRKREDDGLADLSSLKEEMMNMFSALMASQNLEFQKNANTLKEIQKTNESIENSMTFLAAQNKEFQEKIERLEGQVREDRIYISVLEDKIEDMQKDRRKANLEIKNVPRKTSEAKDDLIDMVISLSNNVGCQMVKSDIKDIYRIRGKKDDFQNTPIIVETASTLLKTDVLKMCKAFNKKHKSKLCAKHLGIRLSEDTPIFVSEQLTAKASRLYFLARDLVKSQSYKFCWTAYGKVYLRKEENSRIILIKSESQIQQLRTDM